RLHRCGARSDVEPEPSDVAWTSVVYVWTPIAGVPAAFDPPSASFVLDWGSIRAMRARGIVFAAITLAAGISSTGDSELDRRLPFDEAYRIPEPTASAIRQGRAAGGRIIAIGTTVVRALEHAARQGGVRAGEGIADQRLGPASRLRIVDAILSGTHEPGSSHYQLLRAFLDDTTLADASGALEAAGYRTHEFGDSVLIEKQNRALTLRGASPLPHQERPASAKASAASRRSSRLRECPANESGRQRTGAPDARGLRGGVAIPGSRGMPPRDGTIGREQAGLDSRGS